jgi:invasion protein IalB
MRPVAPIISIDPKSAPVVLAYKRCLPTACFADAELTEALGTSMQAASEPGLITFQMQAGRDVALQMSFKGFAAARAALDAEEK